MSEKGIYKTQKKQPAWNAQSIRALREFLDLTQRQMADELEVRQQTISEWETGFHVPHRSTQKTLTMIAERAGFSYNPTTQPQEDQAPPQEDQQAEG
jgi:DNA-binding transcriptional regulator YiaG